MRSACSARPQLLAKGSKQLEVEHGQSPARHQFRRNLFPRSFCFWEQERRRLWDLLKSLRQLRLTAKRALARVALDQLGSGPAFVRA
jgi:hypothetical protein